MLPVDHYLFTGATSHLNQATVDLGFWCNFLGLSLFLRVHTNTAVLLQVRSMDFTVRGRNLKTHTRPHTIQQFVCVNLEQQTRCVPHPELRGGCSTLVGGITSPTTHARGLWIAINLITQMRAGASGKAYKKGCLDSVKHQPVLSSSKSWRLSN